ncbi:MAG: cyclic nucleotide-binding domain-containing protein [Chloroflexi bacterium]|nr:MAG: cyclic nucleotide-binding domain-containing protein [Chloroflexota bacterium]
MKAIFKQVALFHGLDDSQLDHLIEISHKLTYHQDDIVFEQGSAGDALYIIADGQVGVKVNDTDGDSYVALYLGKGQVFGEMALIDQGTRSATIIAAEDHTEIYRISTQDFITLCTQRPDIGYILMRNIAQDLSFKLRHRSAD